MRLLCAIYLFRGMVISIYFSSMKHLALIGSALLLSTSALAQDWQQTVNTKIEVRLDDKKHFLYGYEEIQYTNNSPDTLRYIYIHLWPNAYKHDHTPFAKQQDVNNDTRFYYSKKEDRGYIDSLQFDIDGKSVDYYNTDNVPDIARIELPSPLLPGHDMKISTPFRVKIPRVFSRLGHTGQAYYISQWFPKPAVYDRKGWHPISLLDQGEFFSDYGSYDVSITLPSNYIVMATGNCSDESENQWLDSLSCKPLPNDTTYLKSWPASDITMKTLHYHEDKVHDFAWFADKRWVVRKDTILSPGTGNLVTAWTAFLPIHQKQWVKGTDYLKETITHYGKWVGPYPYKTVKAVEGDMHAGGGMEYPTVTIIDRSAVTDLQTTIVHEAGHNWFYGMLGTNERDHAWMDEGINTFYEEKTSREVSKKKMSKQKMNADLNNMLYYEAVATHTDQAIDQTSANFTKINYGGDVYFKTALMMRWLEAYMGEQHFQEGMQDYYNTWRFRHPYPEDLQAILQKHTDKSLDWFFDGMLPTDKRIDFKVKRAGKNELIVKSKSDITAPVGVDVYDRDSLMGTIWSAPFEGKIKLQIPDANAGWTKLKIDDDVVDAKSSNDIYKRYGLFKKFRLKIAPVAGLNMSDKEKLFISPALGYNNYDGFMLGLVFHDLTIPENRFRFAFAPMVGFNSGKFVGAGSVGYVWYPDNIFKEILLQADGKTFHYDEVKQPDNKWIYASYTKIAPSLNITFNEHNLLSPVTRTLTLKAYSITEDQFNVADSNHIGLKQQQKTYELLRYRHVNSRAYNPFGYSLEGQLGADFAKLSAEGNLRIDYFKKNKALYVRAYAGKFFGISNDPAVLQRYYLTTTYTGMNDYLYDGTYFDRSNVNSALAQQMYMQEGGLKVPTFNNVGMSDNYLLALNLKTDLPIKLPIRLFLDVVDYSEANSSTTKGKVLYDGGLEIHLGDIFTFNIPLIMSSDLHDNLKAMYGNSQIFPHSLSFSIKLNNINWLKSPGMFMKLVGG